MNSRIALSNDPVFNNISYYVAVSQKDWEQLNSRICLAETDIDRGLDFPFSNSLLIHQV